MAKRPLNRVDPVVLIDPIIVKVRDGSKTSLRPRLRTFVTNRPVFIAIVVPCNGEADILGLWAGDGEGAKF